MGSINTDPDCLIANACLCSGGALSGTAVALQTALSLNPCDQVTAQACCGRCARVWGGLTAAIALSLMCLHCVLLVCRLPLVDTEADKDSDSDEEVEMPDYEYRFETAKLLLELDDSVDTALKVRRATLSTVFSLAEKGATGVSL